MSDTSAAEANENFLVPFVFRPWAELVVGMAHLQPGQGVLDVGCGTGVAAKLAAAVVGPRGSVVGIDIDPGMLSVARRARPQEGAADIDWRQADATRLPIEDSGVDVVLCFESLQFVPDRAKALAEIRRVLKPRGRLAGTVWGPLEENAPYQALADGLARYVSPEAARLPPFTLSDPAMIGALLTGAGFEDVKVEPKRIARPAASAADFVGWVAAGAPTIRYNLGLLSEDNREAFQRFVNQRLEQFETEGVLILPTMRHVFMASRP